MANSAKVSKGLTYKTKSKVILGICIALLILIVGAFFVYISGIATKIIPAVKFEQTIDGQTKTVGKAYVPELNYYRNSILSMYSMYGMELSQEYLDTVDEATGKTNNQLLYDQAAEQVMNVMLVNEVAERDASFVSGAKRYANSQLDLFKARAESNHFPTTDQYLAAVYGTGMSSATYRNIVERQAITQEYEQYLRQFTFMPTEEEYQAAYNENTIGYTSVTFNGYLFEGDDAEKNAKDVAAKATDSDTFNQAIIDIIGEEAATEKNITLESNQTLYSSVSKDSIKGEAFPEGLEAFAFDSANEGKTMTFEMENGWYVACLKDVDDKTDASVSYRSLVLMNTEASKEGAKESAIASECDKLEKKINDIKGGITDELSFVSAVKENTEEYDDILTGGYTSGITAANYSSDNMTQEDITFSTWLLDPARQHGDMLVIRATDNSKVTLYYFDESVERWKNEAAADIIGKKVSDWSTTAINTENTVPYVAYDLAEALTYYARIDAK